MHAPVVETGGIYKNALSLADRRLGMVRTGQATSKYTPAIMATRLLMSHSARQPRARTQGNGQTREHRDHAKSDFRRPRGVKPSMVFLAVWENVRYVSFISF